MQLRVTKVASVTSLALPFGPSTERDGRSCDRRPAASGHDETPADPVGTGSAGVCVDVTWTSG